MQALHPDFKPQMKARDDSEVLARAADSFVSIKSHFLELHES